MRLVATALCLTLCSVPLSAAPIAVGDIKVDAGQTSGSARSIPWSGSWWPMSRGELGQGYKGVDNFTWNQAEGRYEPVSGLKDEDLSPLAKFDRYMERRHGKRTEAALVEMNGRGGYDHHVDPKEAQAYGRDGTSYSWWGICNGWAAAAILEREPLAPLEAEGLGFDVGDIKGLVSLSHFGCDSSFTGTRYADPRPSDLKAIGPARDFIKDLAQADPKALARWYREAYPSRTPLDPKAKAKDYRRPLEEFIRWYEERYDRAFRDIEPQVFHVLLADIVGRQRRSLVFDITAGSAVWNYPVCGYRSTVRLAGLVVEPGGKRLTRHDVETTVTYADDGTAQDVVGVQRFDRNYTYQLLVDDRSRPVRGEWTGASVNEHPDFAWLPLRNSEGADDSENPELEYRRLKEILPQRHLGADNRGLTLEAQGSAAATKSDALREGDTTTWAKAAATGAQPYLRAVSGGDVRRIRFYESRVQERGGLLHPADRRAPVTEALSELGEADAQGGFTWTAAPAGKHMVVARALDAAGRLIAQDELALNVDLSIAPVVPPRPTVPPANATRPAPSNPAPSGNWLSRWLNSLRTPRPTPPAPTPAPTPVTTPPTRPAPNPPTATPARTTPTPPATTNVTNTTNTNRTPPRTTPPATGVWSRFLRALGW